VRLRAKECTDAAVAAGKVHKTARAYAGGARRGIALDEGDDIRAAIAEHPDATAAELVATIWPHEDENRYRFKPLRMNPAELDADPAPKEGAP
jgi:hypothetical protein